MNKLLSIKESIAEIGENLIFLVLFFLFLIPILN